MNSCLFSFSFIGNILAYQIYHNWFHILNFFVTFLFLTTNTAFYIRRGVLKEAKRRRSVVESFFSPRRKTRKKSLGFREKKNSASNVACTSASSIFMCDRESFSRQVRDVVVVLTRTHMYVRASARMLCILSAHFSFLNSNPINFSVTLQSLKKEVPEKTQWND